MAANAESQGLSGQTSERSQVNEELGFGTKTALQLIRAKYPSVLHISTSELAELLQRAKEAKSHRKLILLDVRSRKEFEVSHFRNAFSINPNIEDINQVIELINSQEQSSDELKTVVAYCSIGYRSSDLIQRLITELREPEHQKFKNSLELYNLEGSIFKWANERREVVNSANEKTVYVHPYNIVWGKMLDHNLRSYEPK